jgi:hypothetical protein
MSEFVYLRTILLHGALRADETNFCRNRRMSLLGNVVDVTPHGRIGGVTRLAEAKK